MQERDIFIGAIELNDPAAREQYLSRSCKSDQGLRQRVNQLLGTYERAESFLEHPPCELLKTPCKESITIDPGTIIGPYKLLEPIGEGGMGTVYLAEQNEPVHRTVALKVIKPGMDTRQVIARFEAEEQALAMMDHPNIAKVLDADITESGRPYFVMELVKGIPIHKFCDQHRLDPKQRLDLFIQVCHGVQHAHQKGIIHRDLKPSNILVAMYDDQPVPKVIDFGVAKATGEQLTEKSMITRFGQVVGTLEYMSPEQAQFNQLDVDTRSDIYSLGAILYELLTGRPPFEKKRMKDQALDETLRMIREEEPTKPSAKLSSADHMAQIANNRHTQPHKLSALVHGDLDWIVMKALEKERERRYESATGFALDIERFLKDEPVSAGPPSASYRFRKFARRNKIGLAFTALVGIGLVLAIVGLAVSNHKISLQRSAKDDALKKSRTSEQQARIEAKLAMSLYDFVTQDILQLANANHEPDRNLTMQDALDRAAIGVDQRFVNQPDVAAKVHQTIGNAYESVGEFGKARKHLGRASEIYTELVGPTHPDSIEVELELLIALREDADDQIDVDKHLNKLELLFERCQGLFGPADKLTLQAGNQVAFVSAKSAIDRRDSEKLKQTEKFIRELIFVAKDHFDNADLPLFHLNESLVMVLDCLREFPLEEDLARELLIARPLGDTHPIYFPTRRFLARSVRGQGRYDEAQQLLQKLIDDAKLVLGENHVDTGDYKKELGLTLLESNQFEEAEQILGEVLASHRKSLGRAHSRTLDAVNYLACIQLYQGNYVEAEELWSEAFELRKEKLGPDHSRTLDSQQNLAQAIYRQGRYETALKLAEEVLKIRKRTQGDDHEYTLSCIGLIARICRQQGNYRKEAELKKEVLERKRTIYGERHPSTLLTMNNYANACASMGDWQEGLEVCRKCLGLRQSVLGDEHRDSLMTSTNLAEFLFRTGRLKESRSIAESTLETCRRALGETHPQTMDTIKTLATALRLQGQPAKAEELYREVFEHQLDGTGEHHPLTLETKHQLAVTVNLQQRHAEAQQLLSEVIDARTKQLGPQHPDTLNSRHDLATVLADNGRTREATAIWREVLDQKQKVLGVDHPLTIETELAFTTAMLTLGLDAEAEGLLATVVEKCEAIVSSNYYENRVGLKNVILVLQELGKDDEAAALEAALGGTGK